MRPDVIFINILYIHIIHHIAFGGPDIAPKSERMNSDTPLKFKKHSKSMIRSFVSAKKVNISVIQITD